MVSARLDEISNVMNEVNRLVRLRGTNDPSDPGGFGRTLGEVDWLAELQRLLYDYKETNEQF